MAKVTFLGNEINLTGNEVKVGDRAPVVELVDKDLNVVKVGGEESEKGVEILVVVPSLDTGVCATETRKFNEKMAGKPNIVVRVISMDLPFASGRFCATEGIENVRTLSDFRGAKFGKAYGVLCGDGVLEGLLARAIFGIRNGVVVYKEIVSKVEEEPNYEAVFEAIKSAGGCGCGCSH